MCSFLNTNRRIGVQTWMPIGILMVGMVLIKRSMTYCIYYQIPPHSHWEKPVTGSQGQWSQMRLKGQTNHNYQYRKTNGGKANTKEDCKYEGACEEEDRSKQEIVKSSLELFNILRGDENPTITIKLSCALNAGFQASCSSSTSKKVRKSHFIWI